MSALAVPTHRTLRFWETTIGKKAVMAVTGVILFGFLIGHLAGNLQIFLGPEAINAYAAFLHSKPGVLWAARIGLLAAVALHIWAAIQLTLIKQAARPTAYVRKKNIESSYASRTMMWSGPIIAAFVVYHLAHFTFGVTVPQYDPKDVYRNMVLSFRNPLISGFYIVSMVLLGMHLYHGLWSMFQTLGANHPKYDRQLRRFAQVFTILIAGGNIAMPLAVLAGIVKV